MATVVLDVIGSSESERNATALRLFAESLERWSGARGAPALRWLRAKAFELLGDFRSAEATLEAAESLDESWPLTLMSLARYASDRGNAERGLSLLRRAGMPRTTKWHCCSEFSAGTRAGLGRNERCFCGSGRKYKVCHLNREEPPLEERAAWLYQKSAADLSDGPFSTLLLRAAAERARYWDFPDAIEHALDEGSATPCCSRGAFEDFLATRGFLLPEDERSLAEQWLLCERSVHEVLDVRRGRALPCATCAPATSTTSAIGPPADRSNPVNCIVRASFRLGETMQVFGGLQRVPVGPERDGLIALLDEEPGPVDLVAFLSRGFAPAILRNTEGDPLMLCEATMHVEDPAAVSDALDEAYGPPSSSPTEREPGWNSSSLAACNGSGADRLRVGIRCASRPTAQPGSTASLRRCGTSPRPQRCSARPANPAAMRAPVRPRRARAGRRATGSGGGRRPRTRRGPDHCGPPVRGGLARRGDPALGGHPRASAPRTPPAATI